MAYNIYIKSASGSPSLTYNFITYSQLHFLMLGLPFPYSSPPHLSLKLYTTTYPLLSHSLSTNRLLALLHNSFPIPMPHLPYFLTASDVSMWLANPSPSQHQSITFSVLHNSTTYLLSLPSSSALNGSHGKIYGLIAATFLHLHSTPPPQSTLSSVDSSSSSSTTCSSSSIIHANCLNSVRFIQNVLHHSLLPTCLELPPILISL